MTAPEPPTPNPEHRSGFVAIIGRPNVGKSTLLNRLVGQKVAIVTPTPQTTRSRLQGVVTLPNAQLIFIDTPAIHAPRHRLGAHMVEEARHAIDDADGVLWVIDASDPVTGDDEIVASMLRGTRTPVVIALNKIDRLRAGESPLPPESRDRPTVAGVVPISATTGHGVGRLVEILAALLPEGPPYFPPEMITDQQEQRLVGEFIREQAMLQTREEVPHGIAVEIEEFAPREGEDIIYIRAVLFVEREAHRRIIIGRNGRTLKEIGRRARQEIESLLGSHVYLDLWVKVAKDWRNKDAVMRRLYPN